MNESKRPLQMTGEEIEQTFGASEVSNLEKSCDAIHAQIDALRNIISDHWDDEIMVMQAQTRVDELENYMHTLQIEIRTKRKKYSQTIESAGSISPPS